MLRETTAGAGSCAPKFLRHPTTNYNGLWWCITLRNLGYKGRLLTLPGLSRLAERSPRDLVGPANVPALGRMMGHRLPGGTPVNQQRPGRDASKYQTLYRAQIPAAAAWRAKAASSDPSVPVNILVGQSPIV
jgi:hypothetical protein